MIKRILLALCMVCAWSTYAMAHGVSYGLAEDSAFVAQFTYSGDEPMSYVSVLVYGPQSTPDLEYQNGRTDANGRFAFTPDRAGAWRVEAKDETGHKGVFSVEISEAALQDGHLSAQHAVQGTLAVSTPLKALLGISLMMNLGLAAAIVKRRRNTA